MVLDALVTSALTLITTSTSITNKKMNYYELIFTLISSEDFHQDLLIHELGNLGFDTFEEMDFGFKAYIPTDKYDKNLIETHLISFHDLFTFSYEVNLIPQKNWNEVWESNFEPIFIKDKVYVRANFHPEKKEIPHEIIINPKMAFGTGHHQTTAMMLEHLLESELIGKKVLDMGCGTGILAIMASKLGAKEVLAIDNDSICYESTLENSKLNNIQNIKAAIGSKEDIPTEKFDVILANINRNILIDQMQVYSSVLNNDGIIFFSGFYESPDLDIIMEEARKYNFKYLHHKKLSNWVAAKFIN